MINQPLVSIVRLHLRLIGSEYHTIPISETADLRARSQNIC